MGPGVGLFSFRAPTNDAEEVRLIGRTAVSSQTMCPRLGGNCWSRDRRVRRLLESARLDRRLSWTPPISMDSLSSSDTHRAISLHAHCLAARALRQWERRAVWRGDQGSPQQPGAVTPSKFSRRGEAVSAGEPPGPGRCVAAPADHRSIRRGVDCPCCALTAAPVRVARWHAYSPVRHRSACPPPVGGSERGLCSRHADGACSCHGIPPGQLSPLNRLAGARGC